MLRTRSQRGRFKYVWRVSEEGLRGLRCSSASADGNSASSLIIPTRRKGPISVIRSGFKFARVVTRLGFFVEIRLLTSAATRKMEFRNRWLSQSLDFVSMLLYPARH